MREAGKEESFLDKVLNLFRWLRGKIKDKSSKVAGEIKDKSLNFTLGKLTDFVLGKPNMLKRLLSPQIPSEFPGTNLQIELDPNGIAKQYNNLIKSTHGGKLKSAITKILSNYISDKISNVKISNAIFNTTEFTKQFEELVNANAINSLEPVSKNSSTFVTDVVDNVITVISNPKLMTNIQKSLGSDDVNQEDLGKAMDGLINLGNNEEFRKVVQLMQDAFNWAAIKHTIPNDLNQNDTKQASRPEAVKPTIPNDLNPELKNLIGSHLDSLDKGKLNYSKITDVCLHFADKYKGVVSDVAELIGKDSFINILKDREKINTILGDITAEQENIDRSMLELQQKKDLQSKGDDDATDKSRLDTTKLPQENINKSKLPQEKDPESKGSSMNTESQKLISENIFNTGSKNKALTLIN
jgi:hypothetical protein